MTGRRTTVILTEGDIECIDAIKSLTGGTTIISAIRYAIRTASAQIGAVTVGPPIRIRIPDKEVADAIAEYLGQCTCDQLAEANSTGGHYCPVHGHQTLVAGA